MRGQLKEELKSDKERTKHYSVWIHQNNQLVQRIIKTGLNNNTQVEVLEGLTLNDEVVTGTQNTDIGPVNKETSSSPFMPKRPGGDKNKKK